MKGIYSHCNTWNGKAFTMDRLKDALGFEADIDDALQKWNRCYEREISGLVYLGTLEKRMSKLDSILSGIDLSTEDADLREGVDGLRKRAKEFRVQISKVKDIETSLADSSKFMTARIDDHHVVDGFSTYNRDEQYGSEEENVIEVQNEQLKSLAGVISRHRQLGDAIYNEIEAQQDELDSFDSRLENTNVTIRSANRHMNEIRHSQRHDSLNGEEHQSCGVVAALSVLVVVLIVFILSI
eukprot:CFRG0338T1